MELIVEDKDGRVVGARDLEGSRWEQVGNHFENVQDVAVEITTVGDPAYDMYIRNGNQRIGSETVSGLAARLEPGTTVMFGAGKLRLNYYEQHTPVWGDKARDHGVGGSQVEFAKGAAEAVRFTADDLSRMLDDPDSDPEDVRSVTRALLAAVADLLAALKVTGTEV